MRSAPSSSRGSAPGTRCRTPHRRTISRPSCPAVIRPASQTSYLAARVFADMVGSGVLPPGSASLVCGPVGGLLDNLISQDVVAFTGSAETAALVRRHPAIAELSVPLIVEADSLNAAILGPDAMPGQPEFDPFIREIFREMRRALRPATGLAGR